MNGRRVVDRLDELPLDLGLVMGWVLVANVIVFADVGLAGISLRTQWGFPVIGVIIGLPLLVFLPGYAVISALYPVRADFAERRATGSIPAVDRAMLSVLTSLLVVASVAVVLALSPFGLWLRPVLVVLSTITLLTAGLAVRRRQQLPPYRRFGTGRSSATLSGVLAGTTPGLSGHGGKLFVASLVLFGAVAVSPVFLPPAGDSFSEASLLAENDNGEFDASALPTTFAQGEERTIAIAIENHEGARTTYAVIVRLQRVGAADDGAQRVVEQDRLDTFEATLEDGERTVIERPIRPTLDGTDLRLQYLVFAGGAPDSPSAEGADLVLRLWIEVE